MIIDKIKWRIGLLKNKKEKSFKALICSLLPSRSKLAEWILINEVKKHPDIIKIEKSDKEINLGRPLKDAPFYRQSVKTWLLDMGQMKILYLRDKNLDSPVGVFLDLIYPYAKNYNPKHKLYGFFPPAEGIYEAKGVELKEGDIVIDAGAYVGIFSIFAAKKIGNKGKVYAFEPNYEARQLLKENLKLNDIKNVEVMPFALGKTGFKSIELSTPPDNLGNSSGAIDQEGTNESAIQTSIDNFVENNNIKKVDFIKSDIEGMERDLLFGARNTIKKFKPRLAICTYHRPDDPEILEKMIKDFSPEYKIIKGEKKLFAWM